MGKGYRTIKFAYNTTETQIEVMLDKESIDREDLITIRQSVNGTRYSYVTGYKRRFTYEYDYNNSEVFDFFQDAFEAHDSGQTVTFSLEQDDGSFEDIEVIIRRPQYRDDTLGTTDKVYADMSVEILEI